MPMALDALAMTAFASWPVAVSVSNAINATKVTRNFFDIESSPTVSCRLESVYCETYHLPRSAEIVHDVVDHERLAGIEIVSGGGKYSPDCNRTQARAGVSDVRRGRVTIAAVGTKEGGAVAGPNAGMSSVLQA